MTLDEDVVTAPERELLEGFLELYRGIVPGKLAGLSEAAARRSLVPSSTTLLGLVKHLASVEREWFARVPTVDDWVLDPADTVESVLADYAAACAESRAAVAGLDLDCEWPHERLGAVSLRWVYVHLIEETARHAGHADILREQTDGATGFD